MYNSSSVCAVSFQARALCPQKASKEKHRFIVGTCSLHDNNELTVLKYLEDSNHFEIANVYAHNDQIWAVESSPKDTSLVVTSRQSNTGFKSVTLWSLPKQTYDDISDDAAYSPDILELEEKASFNQSQKVSFVHSIKWHPTQEQLLTIDHKILTAWNIRESSITQSNSFILGFEEGGNKDVSRSASAASWNPHDPSCCAASSGDSIQFIDTRDMEVSLQKRNAHNGNIRDIDYNPNKPFTLMTAGDDRKIKFWDMRKPEKPIVTLSGHSHWVWAARYNPYHDQLVLSGGSDNMVNLWRIASCSSTPWISVEEQGDEEPPNVRVRAIDQHEDSVYNVAWSPADAWIYCSLSLDGRAIINHVPSTEKYKILL